MLKVKNLNVIADIEKNPFHILRDVSLDINKGEILGVAGESGSGKSILSKTILNLIKKPVVKTAGIIELDGQSLESEDDFKPVRGGKISMIFQNPTASLNPVFKIGDQLMETIRLHYPDISKKEAKEKAVQLLTEVEIKFPEERLNAYPHQLSGGMNQRVMIALALASDPELLIADEPTTALDVTIQKQIISLLLKLKEQKNLAIMFITHDIKLLAEIADKSLIIYAGEILEEVTKEQLKQGKMRHPYTFSLKKCVPELGNKGKLYTIPGVIDHNTPEYENCCIFHKRCFKTEEKCRNEKPEMSGSKPKCFFEIN